MYIKGFIESSLIEWPGKISSIIFTAGCNFKCPFCHNPELVNLNKNDEDFIPEEFILKKLESKKKWIDGLVITGGEPTLQDDLIDFIKKVKSLGILVKLETNGSNPETIKKILDEKLADYVAMDIKTSLSSKKYNEAVGIKISLENILDTIDILMNSKIDYEFRTTLVPGIVEKEDIISIAEKIQDAKKWILQNFRNINTLEKSFSEFKPYSLDEVEEFKNVARQILKKCVIE
jgi:pyruvate formate lyase activating enzyme